MSSLPSHLIKLRILKEIPVHDYNNSPVTGDMSNTKERLSFLQRLRGKNTAEQQAATPKKSLRSRDIAFNAAIWMNFMEAPEHPVSLWINYEDSRGEHSLLIDEQSLGGGKSAMLSGSVSAKVVGELVKLRACAGGIADQQRFSVDDLHVEKVKQEYTANIQRFA